MGRSPATSEADDPLDGLFPRDLYGRIALGLASLTLGPAFAVAAVAIAVGRPPGAGFWWWALWAVLGEVFLALTLFFACGLVWALATPRWLERRRRGVVLKLAMALLLGLIPFVAMVVLAALGGG